MAKYQLTPDAHQDLRDIRVYLKSQSASAWKIVRAALKRAFDQVAKAPGIGHWREDLTGRPFRFHLCPPYFVVYDPATRPLRIIGIYHCSRDLSRDRRLA